MDDFDKVKPLTAEDRELLSDLTSTFDLGTQSLIALEIDCLLYTSPSPRDGLLSRMPSSA